MVERSPFDSLTGTTLGNYCLEELIEQNEASSVFRARNTVAGALFRLLVIAVPPDLKPEDRIVYLGRFQREANQVSALHHQHILPLVDYAIHNAVGDPKGTSWPYLVSPYLSVKSLSTFLAWKGPIDATLTGRYLDQITSALEYAHQKAILHRNLTTNCIFINQDGNLLVADFGIIHMLLAGNRYNRSNMRKGVYGMSEASAPAPEQILGQATNTYTDVYALGAVLYRMLTGHRVFRGKTREEMIQLHLQAPIPSLSVWRSDLPKALDDVIARAMAKEAAQRYLHPGEVANAYHQIIAPHDMQRVPFSVAMPSTIRSEQSQGIYSSSGERAKSGEVKRGGSAQVQGGRSTQSAPISRRRALGFIAAGGGVAAAVLAVAVFGKNYLGGNTAPANTSSTNISPANTPIANQTSTKSQGNVLALTSDLPNNSAKKFPIAGQSNPGIIVHLADGRFVAFDTTCTHAGCAVNYSQQDKLLECPCHGAEFDPAKNAAVVQGPAQTPLASLKITINADGTITRG
jgi:eukaryotic-like serine/threonine-protein kinase